MDEKRQFPRLEKQFILSYHDLQNPEEINGVSTLKDISKGGLSFVGNHHFKPGQMVGVQLRTALYPVPVNFEGEVVSASEIVGQYPALAVHSLYLIRLRFVEISEDAEIVVEKVFQVLAKKK